MDFLLELHFRMLDISSINQVQSIMVFISKEIFVWLNPFHFHSFPPDNAVVRTVIGSFLQYCLGSCVWYIPGFTNLLHQITKHLLLKSMQTPVKAGLNSSAAVVKKCVL
jgi:hypothetical protein